MKIVILAKNNSIHTIRWVNSLVERNHEVHLISMHSGGDKIDSRIVIHNLPIPAPFGYFLNAFIFRKLLKVINPDLLHVHFASGYGTLGRLGGYHPYILSVWGSDVYDYSSRSFLYKYLLRKNLRSADKICSTSHDMAKQTNTICKNLKEITVIPFGIDLKQFSDDLYRSNHDYIVIGTVKTLEHKYGIDLLIKSFSQVRQRLFESHPNLADKLRLLVVGGGNDRCMLEELVVSQGIASVTTFAGEIRHSEVACYLKRLDIYVALSRQESFGVAVLEASACSLPVVVSDVGGLPEVVIDAHTGFIVPNNDVVSASDAIASLILNQSLMKKIGRNGREYVVSKYNWSINVTEMEQVYKEVLLSR